MKQIPSFSIDHTKLKSGLYTSMIHELAPDIEIDTLDIRICEPYVDTPMTSAVAHTIEHLGATFLRSMWPNNIIYFGPMGCLTGFYLILRLTPFMPNPFYMVTECFKFISDEAFSIPGATKKECGNYEMMDLAGANAVATKYLHTLLTDKNKYDGKTRYSY